MFYLYVVVVTSISLRVRGFYSSSSSFFFCFVLSVMSGKQIAKVSRSI